MATRQCPTCEGAGEIVETLGMRARDARKELGWTQEELADEIGFTRATVANIEGGRAQTTIPNLAKLADALEVSIDWLVRGVE